ncbi:MAG TPA: class I SAM-dependent methyltransferase [Bacteroidetes bacterium]|nr:class I SAM-dependent methyltransferase [Bacteroidota bacterium]
MKIQHSPYLFLLLFFFLLTGCHSEPPTGSATSKPVPLTDTSNQQTAADEEKAASLEKLLKQYNPPGRDAWQKPEKVIGKMGDLSDKVVADLGAGSGEFSFRLAQEAKKVIALEIDERFIQLMDSLKLIQLKPEFQHRLETRKVTPTDSKLKPGEADIILIVNTYIYIKDRINYLKHLLEVMPEGGQIIIVDFKKKRIPIKFPRQETRLELYKVENELYRAGFKNIVSDDSSLNYQYIVSAEK